MMPRLNYNSMDHRRSTDPGADEGPEVSEHRYIDLESFEVPDTEKKPPAQSTPLLMSGKNIPTRIASYFRGFCSGDGGEESYDKLSSDSGSGGKSVYDVRRKLGALGGVFAPVALGQLATNIFLRVGFIIGQAGLLEALAQLVLAYLILKLTVLSINAISTNGAVEGGGAYYMISRALGPEFGGSIGFLFFVANVLSCGLYTAGFVEGVLLNFGQGGSFMEDGEGLPVSKWWTYLYASVVLFFCFIICIIGGAMFARTSALILLVVVICTLTVFISVFVKNETIEVGIPASNTLVYHNSSDNTTVYGDYTGLSLNTFKKNLFENYTRDYTSDAVLNFPTVFAILFSSVTGILNGANMSGELKDPSKAIPKGTLSAVAFTFFTYVIMTLLLAGSCDRFLLQNNYVFLQEINVWPPFVVIGIFAATLSAALGNLIGASRILEALANDQLFGMLLKPATITTSSGNPYVAVLISWFLVQLVLLIGSLNAIAPITSVFFLLSYASVNLACLGLELASAPNFRPTFRYFTWHTCLLGLIGCMVMCFLISALYSSVALILMLVLIIMLHFRSLPSTWGSISQALIFHQVRKYLLMLDPRKSHVKYWRPQVLLMVANPRQSCQLMDFVNDVKKSGLYVIGHVRTGRLADYPTDPVNDVTSHWLKMVDHLKIKAFVEVTLSSSVNEGFAHLVRVAGLGGMKPNTVCLGFYDDTPPVDTLVATRPRKRRFFTRDVENGTYSQVESFFDGIRDSEDQRRLSPWEYVTLVVDSLKMHKNVCLCRHFHLLDKQKIVAASSSSSYNIDVWPVNLFQPHLAGFFDNTSLFMLQIACILTMVPSWRSGTRLRVFLPVSAEAEDSTARKKQKLDLFLRQLRIIAVIQLVSWDHLPPLPPSPSPSSSSGGGGGEEGDVTKMHEYREVPENYVKALNELILTNSGRTAVTFLYLPTPPPTPPAAPEGGEGVQRAGEGASYARYLSQLDGLTQNLGPTVLVHGLHPVTSTTL
ncbi:LOW QUALITY PROTEIN: solute carrier family 12 member 9-like [Babylonia areolata]|uniref:LOW QUALITY PROTEIN: solute carrier family 12 member 9-like n=1 Tax=Babylonia areolata TaxID=304850 RepID=UPI003FD4D5B2